MNTIREIQSINKRELETLTPPEASWHRDFADTAFIYIGGLPFDFSEGDILTIFSQYGEPTYINLIRDNESGKSKGFCFLKYEDQRSTDLAVDNLGGANVMGRVLKVDHTRYKRKDGEEEEEAARELRETARDGGVSEEGDREEKRRPLIKEEIELLKLEREHDEDDPMKEYLVQERKEEVVRALAKLGKDGKEGEKKKKKSHHHDHRNHRDKDGRRERRRSDASDDREGRRHRHTHHHLRRSRSP